MIRRLVLAALAEGLPAAPAWSSVTGLILDVGTGQATPGTFLTLLPRRSSDSEAVTGFLAEKGENLQPGNRYRAAQAALAERWASETGHPLPKAVASLLRANSAIPDDPRWVAFALDGKTCADFPELHPTLWAAAAPDLLAAEECVGCGNRAPVVELHSGVPAMGNVVPILVSWDRGEIVNRGERRRGANLPTCLSCMYLYVQWLNKHISYHHLSGQHTFVLDGQQWFLSANVRAGFVADVIKESATALLWEAAVDRQTKKRERKMNAAAEAKWRERLDAIDRLVAETHDERYLMGYLYGVLEWAAWIMRLPTPTLEEVSQAPAIHMSAMLLACHDGVNRYAPAAESAPEGRRGRPSKTPEDKPPRTTRGVLRQWLHHVTMLATARMDAMPKAPLRPDELATFALGYAHSLSKRGPQRSSDEINGHDPTPWARRLAFALSDRGVDVALEHRVEYVQKGQARHVRIDVAVLDAKLAIEVDGRLRGLDTRDHARDSRKSAVLLAQGWRVQRVPNARLNRDGDIAEVAEEIIAILDTIRAAQRTDVLVGDDAAALLQSLETHASPEEMRVRRDQARAHLAEVMRPKGQREQADTAAPSPPARIDSSDGK